RTLKSGLTIGMLVAALAMTGGCGDNDNSDNGNDNGGPGPVRTATPGPAATPTTITATATPVTQPTQTPGEVTQQTVDFDFTAANGIQAFQVRVAYPTAKGSFTGAADQVACTVTGGGGIFTKNDNDAAGTLTLSVANTSDLTFPVNVECTFDATAAITSDDLTVTVQEVTQDNAPGNIADLTVNTTVS
ncbi:MAG: hypothetical protein IT294_13260, partial [Deltaproteobacteria bacterium]|nr:hypothetical protein [Deltaproteobacteria bacterium]